MNGKARLRPSKKKYIFPRSPQSFLLHLSLDLNTAVLDPKRGLVTGERPSRMFLSQCHLDYYYFFLVKTCGNRLSAHHSWGEREREVEGREINFGPVSLFRQSLGPSSPPTGAAERKRVRGWCLACSYHAKLKSAAACPACPCLKRVVGIHVANFSPPVAARILPLEPVPAQPRRQVKNVSAGLMA